MTGPNIPLPEGYRLEVFDQLDSTNSEGLRRARDGEPHGLWILAASQDKGRGRFGRNWESLSGNLFASILLRPDCSAKTAAQLGFVGGNALHDAVEDFTGTNAGPEITLKWPNDLLCESEKAGGMLLESVSDGSTSRAVIMGVGLNLRAHPQDTEFPATDLSQHGIEATPVEILELLAKSFHRWYGVWNKGAGFEDIRRAWMERTLPLNTPLSVRLSNERLQGTYGGINPDGALILALADGGERLMTTGDIFPL